MSRVFFPGKPRGADTVRQGGDPQPRSGRTGGPPAPAGA